VEGRNGSGGNSCYGVEIAQAQTECSKHEKKLSSIAYVLLVNRGMIPSKDGFVEEEGSKEPETRPIA
jgi:hypothetical protein